MKKLVLSVLLSLLTIGVFCFDYNKDNFSVILDEGTALFVYKDKIYIFLGMTVNCGRILVLKK